jgi:hypothetical protein
MSYGLTMEIIVKSWLVMGSYCIRLWNWSTNEKFWTEFEICICNGCELSELSELSKLSELSELSELSKFSELGELSELSELSELGELSKFILYKRPATAIDADFSSCSTTKLSLKRVITTETWNLSVLQWFMSDSNRIYHPQIWTIQLGTWNFF